MGKGTIYMLYAERQIFKSKQAKKREQRTIPKELFAVRVEV